MFFSFSNKPLDPFQLKVSLISPETGAFASFEGLVRNHSEGKKVVALEYEAYEPLALKEAEKILKEAGKRFDVVAVKCVHRLGHLKINDLAVWVGVSASHRDDAFKACRFIIDEIKSRLPIWKKEIYENGDSGWVNCEVNAGHPRHTYEV